MAYQSAIAMQESQKWQHRATYSMEADLRDGTSRDGTTYFDCSGFVYHVLCVAGAWDNSYLQRSHFTGTLKHDLEAAGFVEISGDQVGAGDVFIWGDNYGAGAGSASHTGLFVDNDKIIHSSWYTAGQVNEAVVILKHDYYWQLDGQPEYHFFHYTGGSGPAPTPPADTYNEKFRQAGNAFSFANTPFKVDAIKQVNGIWQMADYRTVGGAANNFDWDSNGLPLDIMHRIDGGDDNNVAVGARLQFDAAYNHGTVDQYRDDIDYLGIDFGDYGRIWFESRFAYLN
ncbi:MAG: C40 family peptidase [Streptococcaceae bacterium]|jgi:hypothetical protein|nr:C40 family peptidase [Streptococcaceae bacterium]